MCGLKHILLIRWGTILRLISSVQLVDFSRVGIPNCIGATIMRATVIGVLRMVATGTKTDTFMP